MLSLWQIVSTLLLLVCIRFSAAGPLDICVSQKKRKKEKIEKRERKEGRERERKKGGRERRRKRERRKGGERNRQEGREGGNQP